jgi:cytochrome c biogenesis protein ResB
MTMKSATLITVTLACALSACSTDAPPPPKTAAQPAQQTILDPQLKALQKAKDVQKVMDDRKKTTDKQLDDQGG